MNKKILGRKIESFNKQSSLFNINVNQNLYGTNYYKGVVINFETKDFSLFGELVSLVNHDIVWDISILDWSNYKHFCFEKENFSDRNIKIVKLDFDKVANQFPEKLGSKLLDVQIGLFEISEIEILRLLKVKDIRELLFEIMKAEIKSRIAPPILTNDINQLIDNINYYTQFKIKRYIQDFYYDGYIIQAPISFKTKNQIKTFFEKYITGVMENNIVFYDIENDCFKKNQIDVRKMYKIYIHIDLEIYDLHYILMNRPSIEEVLQKYLNASLKEQTLNVLNIDDYKFDNDDLPF